MICQNKGVSVRGGSYSLALSEESFRCLPSLSVSSPQGGTALEESAVSLRCFLFFVETKPVNWASEGLQVTFVFEVRGLAGDLSDVPLARWPYWLVPTACAYVARGLRVLYIEMRVHI